MKKVILLLVILFTNGLANAQIKKGSVAPDIRLNTPEGKEISLYELKGKLILLDFWASWCGPCRAANPELVDIYKEYHPYGFDVFSVSLDKKRELWVAAIEKDGLLWKNHGSDFQVWDSKPAAMYGIDGIPTSILMDEHHNVLLRTYDIKEVHKLLKSIYNDQVNVYPCVTTGKLLFSDKVKYDIFNEAGVSVLKGKDDQVDIRTFPIGKYKIDLDGRAEYIQKIDTTNEKPTIVLDVNKEITFAKDFDYGIYLKNGMLIQSGRGSKVSIQDLKSGTYFIELNGELISFERK